jgi:hypothetical protein
MNVGVGFGRLLQSGPLLWHLPNMLSRMTVIQRACRELGAGRYLEIGVSTGDCFAAIEVPQKVGVDPIAPAPLVEEAVARPGAVYHQMTSDDFFARVAPTALSEGIDVAFIDGLHTDRQAYRDCLNTLRYLRRGGVIFLHDNLPTTAAEALVANSYEDVRRRHIPGWSGQWMGDAWKAIVRLRALHPDLNACVLHCDYGLGVVWQAPSERVLSYTESEIDALSFTDLEADRMRLLGLSMPARIDDIIETCRANRARS